jgi:hypothetical protein
VVGVRETKVKSRGSKSREEGRESVVRKEI